MADFDIYENTVRNYTGGQELTLNIFSRDGQIGIRLSAGDDQRAALLEIAEARRVIDALNEAIKNAKSKG